MASEEGQKGTERSRDDSAASTHAQLDKALDLALGGFALLDQGLELSGGGFVHLLGADGSGRLVLVLLVSESDEETVTRALEALELAIDHGPVLHHHLSDGDFTSNGIDPRLAPRLLLIGEDFDLARVRKLSTFCARQENAELHELRSLRTARGETLFLYRLAGRSGRAVRASAVETQPRSVERPERSERPERVEKPVRSERNDLLELLTQRLRGLDPALEQRVSRGTRTWLHRGETLVESRAERSGEIHARIEGQDEVVLRNARELDLFLERVVSEYLRRMGSA